MSLRGVRLTITALSRDPYAPPEEFHVDVAATALLDPGETLNLQELTPLLDRSVVVELHPNGDQ